MGKFLMVNEQEILDYLTREYSAYHEPVQKEWTFQEHFNFVEEDLEDMLLDLFDRYNINYEKFQLDEYFEPELPWWRRKPPPKERKPLTVEMITESAKAGKWLYD